MVPSNSINERGECMSTPSSPGSNILHHTNNATHKKNARDSMDGNTKWAPCPHHQPLDAPHSSLALTQIPPIPDDVPSTRLRPRTSFPTKLPTPDTDRASSATEPPTPQPTHSAPAATPRPYSAMERFLSGRVEKRGSSGNRTRDLNKSNPFRDPVAGSFGERAPR